MVRGGSKEEGGSILLVEAIVKVGKKWREAFRVDPSGHLQVQLNSSRHLDMLTNAWRVKVVELGEADDWLVLVIIRGYASIRISSVPRGFW
jgi:hypothetical protein